MADTMTATGFTQENFEAFLESRNEPDWLTQLRRESWGRFQDMAWPARNEEEWMRTDIRLFKLDKFALPAENQNATTAARAVLAEGVDLAGACSSFNSHPGETTLDPELQKKGVLFGSLDQLLLEHGDLLKPYLFNAFNPQYDRFAALHAACWCGGNLLYVPRGVTLEKPFHMLSTLGAGGVDLGHTLVIVEDGAEATVLSELETESEEGDGLHCGGVELILGRGAFLRYVNLQDWNQRVWHFAHQKAIVGGDASLQWTTAALGARTAKVNQDVELAQPGANCQVNGVLFTENKQHLSCHTTQHHVAPNCRSDFLYKAALQDRSRTVWRGMIRVDKQAQQTDGYQRNDNLLLSERSRADSIPGLEIEADDVRCTHGSTTGRVDDELIFYAQCRGYTRKEAIRMIVTGFFQQIFDRITIESVREALGHAIARRVREYE